MVKECTTMGGRNTFVVDNSSMDRAAGLYIVMVVVIVVVIVIVVVYIYIYIVEKMWECVLVCSIYIVKTNIKELSWLRS